MGVPLADKLISAPGNLVVGVARGNEEVDNCVLWRRCCGGQKVEDARLSPCEQLSCKTWTCSLTWIGTTSLRTDQPRFRVLKMSLVSILWSPCEHLVNILRRSCEHPVNAVVDTL